jgi:hypothetical protein
VRIRMRRAEVAESEGVGRVLIRLIRLWKYVRKSKNPPSEKEAGTPARVLGF